MHAVKWNAYFWAQIRVIGKNLKVGLTYKVLVNTTMFKFQVWFVYFSLFCSMQQLKVRNSMEFMMCSLSFLQSIQIRKLFFRSKDEA